MNLSQNKDIQADKIDNVQEKYFSNFLQLYMNIEKDRNLPYIYTTYNLKDSQIPLNIILGNEIAHYSLYRYKDELCQLLVIDNIDDVINAQSESCISSQENLQSPLKIIIVHTNNEGIHGQFLEKDQVKNHVNHLQKQFKGVKFKYIYINPNSQKKVQAIEDAISEGLQKIYLRIKTEQQMNQKAEEILAKQSNEKIQLDNWTEQDLVKNMSSISLLNRTLSQKDAQLYYSLSEIEFKKFGLQKKVDQNEDSIKQNLPEGKKRFVTYEYEQNQLKKREKSVVSKLQKSDFTSDDQQFLRIKAFRQVIDENKQIINQLSCIFGDQLPTEIEQQFYTYVSQYKIIYHQIISENLSRNTKQLKNQDLYGLTMPLEKRKQIDFNDDPKGKEFTCIDFTTAKCLALSQLLLPSQTLRNYVNLLYGLPQDQSFIQKMMNLIDDFIPKFQQQIKQQQEENKQIRIQNFQKYQQSNFEKEEVVLNNDPFAFGFICNEFFQRAIISYEQVSEEQRGENQSFDFLITPDKIVSQIFEDKNTLVKFGFPSKQYQEFMKIKMTEILEKKIEVWQNQIKFCESQQKSQLISCHQFKVQQKDKFNFELQNIFAGGFKLVAIRTFYSKTDEYSKRISELLSYNSYLQVYKKTSFKVIISNEEKISQNFFIFFVDLNNQEHQKSYIKFADEVLQINSDQSQILVFLYDENTQIQQDDEVFQFLDRKNVKTKSIWINISKINKFDVVRFVEEKIKDIIDERVIAQQFYKQILDDLFGDFSFFKKQISQDQSTIQIQQLFYEYFNSQCQLGFNFSKSYFTEIFQFYLDPLRFQQIKREDVIEILIREINFNQQMIKQAKDAKIHIFGLEIMQEETQQQLNPTNIGCYQVIVNIQSNKICSTKFKKCQTQNKIDWNETLYVQGREDDEVTLQIVRYCDGKVLYESKMMFKQIVEMSEKELNPTNNNYAKAKVKMQNELVDFYQDKTEKNLEIMCYRKNQLELLKLFIPNNKIFRYSYGQNINQKIVQKAKNQKENVLKQIQVLEKEKERYYFHKTTIESKIFKKYNSEKINSKERKEKWIQYYLINDYYNTKEFKLKLQINFEFDKLQKWEGNIEKYEYFSQKKLQEKVSNNLQQQKLKETQKKKIQDYQCEFMRSLQEVYLKIYYLIHEITQAPEQERLDIFEKNKMIVLFFKQINILRQDFNLEQNESMKNSDFNQNILMFLTFFSNFSIIKDIAGDVLENLVNHRKYLILQTQDIEKSFLQEELQKIQENNLEDTFLERTDNGAKLMANIDSVAFFAVALKWCKELSSPFNTNLTAFASLEYQKELIFDKMYDLDEKELFKCISILKYESKKVRQVKNKFCNQEIQNKTQLAKIHNSHNNTAVNSSNDLYKQTSKVQPENYANTPKKSFISSLFSCFKTRK
ncbi:hypothetical protein ABPG74_020959 [Tetrahymena malaccensis]